MADRIERLTDAIQLSQQAKRVVWQNIIFSLAVIAVLISGVFVVNLPLPLGVFGHEGSTVIVVLNGLSACCSCQSSGGSLWLELRMFPFRKQILQLEPLVLAGGCHWDIDAKDDRFW